VNRAELLKAIVSTGQENTFRATPEWAAAFKAYNEGTGNRREMKCGACYREVLNWLKA